MRQMTEEERKNLGLRIKTARKQKGLSQAQLAELVGCKVGTISKYEQGYRTPDVGMLIRIANVLECNLAEMAGTADEVANDVSPHHEAIERYIAWLRSAHVVVDMRIYEDDDRNEKAAIIVNIDGELFDVGEIIDEILDKNLDHFLMLAKQFGDRI